MTEVEEVVLVRAIRQELHCGAMHLCSVFVREDGRGAVAWEGYVEIFQLFHHAEAQECYAWVHTTEDGETEYILVLRLPPIATALQAVRAYTAAQAMKL
jgi:hypothetical protein